MAERFFPFLLLRQIENIETDRTLLLRSRKGNAQPDEQDFSKLVPYITAQTLAGPIQRNDVTIVRKLLAVLLIQTRKAFTWERKSIKIDQVPAFKGTH